MKYFLTLISFIVFIPIKFSVAGGTPDPGTGNSRDNQLFGSFNNTNGPNGGDFVNSTGGLNSNWLYNIEIPPSQTNLTVEIFDADVRGKFAAGEIHDTADDNNANGAQATYRLINPLGVQVATATIGQDTTFDNTWAVLNSNFSVSNPIPGHWQLEYDLVSTTGAQGNTYGVRAHDGTSGAGGIEYNMYSPTYVPLGHGEDTDGTNPGNEDQNYYPYVTRGCFIDINDFDLDFDGAYSLTSPTSDTFNSPAAALLSGNGLWNQESFTGWASTSLADDYGLWELFFDGINTNGVPGSTGQNLGALYVGDETTANPVPTTNPINNAFRIYLPADGSDYANGSGTIIEPTLPYLTQSYSQSCNTVTVTIEIVNPARANGSTPLPIEFDTSTAGTNVVTVNVPTNGGASTVANGTENPSVGTASVSGNTVTWAPGLVDGGTTQSISFDVSLDRTFGTGPFTIINSTLATFVDQTCAGASCAGTQLQGATVQFGPLCPLSANACDLVALEGTVYNDLDANAILDGADMGMQTVTVNLLNSSGNPVLDGMGNPITTTTAADGSYSFTDLPAGTYAVSVDTSTLPGATPSNIPAPVQTEDPDETGICGTCDSQTTIPITIPIGETVSNIDFGYTGDSLPVTLSSFGSDLVGKKLNVTWGTSSELFNVGFQIWGLDATDSKWDKLHGWLIRSGSGNTVEPQSYAKTVSIPGTIRELVAVGISTVDSDGSEHYFGPFNISQSYGSLNTLKPIAWNHIRTQVDAQMASRGYVKDRVNGYRKVNSSASTAFSSTTDSVIELRVRDSGMYRITSRELLDLGIDWRNVSKRDIALLDYLGNSVVRYVLAQGTGSGSSKTLGENGEIYFFAKNLSEYAGIYTDTQVYRLAVDRYRAITGQYQPRQGIKSGFSDFYMETSRVENDTNYMLSSSADDPWVDAVVLSYPYHTGSYAAGIPVEDDALWVQPSLIQLELARSSGLKAVDGNGDGRQDPEHVIEGQVLSSQGSGGLLALGSQQAVGTGHWHVNFEIPGNSSLSLVNGKAIVGGIFSAGTGYAFSEVQVDAASLTYARPYVAKKGNNHLAFIAPNSGELGYKITLPDSGWPMVFAYNEQGSLVRMAFESQSRITGPDHSRQRIVKFSTLNGARSHASSIRYWISGKRGFPSVESLSVKSIKSKSVLLSEASGSNYLMISHPAFSGATLQEYADFKQRQGYRVSIIDYLQIVEAFGGGQPGPHGLTNYLAEVNALGDLEHVLLVGGSSYDHTDKLNTGAITFIPGHYGQSGYSKFTVSDAPYITNTKNELFSSIGRWPVRTNADLLSIVDKSIAWASTDHGNGDVLVIAENTVAGENINFAAALDNITSLFPASWKTANVHVDSIAEANNLSLPGELSTVLSLAKTQVIEALNNTPDLVLYNGHGTTRQLSNKGLFKSSDVTAITAQGSEIWLPMSCYVTFYESTHVNTLAHQLMFNANAVNITGAMLLSNQAQNISAGKAIIEQTFKLGKTIGEAVNSHKTNRKNSHLNINLSILGDPTLKM